MSLASKYFDRLGLDSSKLDKDPTLSKLSAIVEAHLEHIPFENLSQHGAIGAGPVVLDTNQIALKLLDHRRGGFCLELNGLLAELLIELGYTVLRVPAHVYSPVNGSFIDQPSHLGLIVTVPLTGLVTYVDVGFGEPALAPLLFELDKPQTTPEGMISRFVKDDEFIALEWLDHNKSEFLPRLRFKAAHADIASEKGPALQDFEPYLKLVLDEQSIFSQKIVVTRLTRQDKLTVAGHRFKHTGPPRFGSKSTKIVEELNSVERVRHVLHQKFGIPLEGTEGLTLKRSQNAPPELWM